MATGSVWLHKDAWEGLGMSLPKWQMEAIVQLIRRMGS